MRSGGCRYVVKETVLPNATKIMEIVRENASLFDGYVPEWTYELECHVVRATAP